MELNRLLEITNDRERCAFCPDEDCTDICARCDKVNPITAGEMRGYYQQVREALTENAKLRSKLKIMQEEYLETCSSDCAGDQESGILPCKHWVAPDVDENNMRTKGYCSIWAELDVETHERLLGR